MAIIQFNLNSKSLIYPFMTPIFTCLRLYLMLNYKTQHLIIMVAMFMGELLCFIPELILQHLSKKENRQNALKDQNQKFVPKPVILIQPQPRIVIKKEYLLLFIFLFSFIDSTTFYCLSIIIAMSDTNLTLQMKIVFIIFTVFFSKIILNFPFYKHQKFSFILIILAILLITTLDIIYKSINLLTVVCYTGIYCLMSIQKVLEKYSMEYLEITLYQLLSYEGLFGLLITIVYAIPLYYLKCGVNWKFCIEEKSIDDIIMSFEYMFSDIFRVLDLIGIILTSLFLNVFNQFTSYKLSPNHRSVSETLSALLWWVLYDIISDENQEGLLKLVIAPITYVLLICGCFVYNEIIIIYICELEYDTTKEIRKRQELVSSNNFLFNQT